MNAIGFDWRGTEFLERRRKIVLREVTWAGRNMQRDIVQRHRAPGKSGRVYLSRGAGVGRKGGDYEVRPGPDGRNHRYRRGRRYTSSAAGQSPAVDLGILANRIAYAVREGAWRISAAMGIAAGRSGSEALLLVATSLETGAKFKKRRGGIDPRPSFGPALLTEGRLFKARLFRALQSAGGGRRG